jgi:hypothetical protein
VPDPRSVTMIAAICRSLDGIPLAIELAAARAPVLGVQALAARIDDRFRLLTGGRRTALARHQALRATFDWSYELLAESERLRGPWSDSRQDDRHRLTRPRRARATGFRQKCYSIMCLAPTRHNRGDLSHRWGRIWTDRLPTGIDCHLRNADQSLSLDSDGFRLISPSGVEMPRRIEPERATVAATAARGRRAPARAESRWRAS